MLADSKSKLTEAMQLLANRKFDESEKIFQGLLKDSVLTADSLYGIGLIRFASGQTDLAEHQFLECIKADAHHANAMFYLGRIAEMRKDEGSAINYYNQAIKCQPDHVGAKMRRDILLRTQGAVPVDNTPSVDTAAND